MKKRMIAVLCLMLAVCLVLSACGKSENKDLSESKYLGTWKAVSMVLKDTTGTYDDELYIVLNADGTAIIRSDSEEDECRWQETKDGFKLTDGANMTFKDDSGTVTSKVLGVTILFEKQ